MRRPVEAGRIPNTAGIGLELAGDALDPSEEDARRRGIAFRVAKLPIAAVLRSRTTSETRGFMKALVEAHGDRILGFIMLGAEAGEVMTAMLTGMPFTGLRDAIIAHPTMAEDSSRSSRRSQLNKGRHEAVRASQKSIFVLNPATKASPPIPPTLV